MRGIALCFATDNGASMAATVQKHSHPHFIVAAQDQRTAADRTSTKIAGRAHFGFVPDIDPATIKNALALALKDCRIDQGCPIDPKIKALRVVDDHRAFTHRVILSCSRFLESDQSMRCVSMSMRAAGAAGNDRLVKLVLRGSTHLPLVWSLSHPHRATGPIVARPPILESNTWPI